MQKQILAAFSLGELEQMKGYTATFARRKGSKDKKKRVSKLGLAAAGAGALAATGAAARYGGAALAKRRPMNSDQTFAERVKNAQGARGLLKKDAGKAGASLSKLGRNIQGQARSVPGELQNLGQALKGGFRKGAGDSKGVGKAAKGAIGALRAGIGTKAGKVGAGLGAAAALGGAGYAASRLLRKKKDKK